MLALRGGGELVALWAQLGSLLDVVIGVAHSGVSTGLAVYAARTQRPERLHDLLREALRLGLLVSLPVALAVCAAGILFQDFLLGGRVPAALIAVGAAAAWVAVIPNLVNNFWLGRQQRGLMLALAAFSGAAGVAAALAAPRPQLLAWIALSQALPAVALLAEFHSLGARPRFRKRSHPLARYILPGLVIGILSPASLLVARAAVGQGLSWQDAGVLQALWRLSDWVWAFSGGILSVYFLPRFAAARAGPALGAELRRSAVTLLLPSAAVFVLLYFLQQPLLAALYDESFVASDAGVALIFAGSLIRIAAWIPLFALYALRRTRAIAAGELLSLPLFALLTVLAEGHLSLELAGLLWSLCYLGYLAFNLWILRRS